MATLEKEDFWGCELKKGSTQAKFNPEFEDSELSQVEHKLILSQACLGPKASGRCLIEVTAHDYKGDEQKNVIACLQSGSTEMCPLNLSFSPPASFKLIEGNGPVHLTGNHVQSLAEDELDSSDESDEDEAPQLVDSKAALKNKRPLPSSTPSGPPKKIAKTKDEDSDDEEEESSDEEEEETPQKPSPAKKDNKKKPQTKEIDEEDDDDEDDSDEDEDDDDDDAEKDEDFEGSESGDEDESEEESDEEESDSEEEEEESDEITKTLTGKKDSAKKPMTNGISSKKDDKKPAKTQQKTPPKTEKPKDVDSIKKALLKSPALPKKMDKFKNYMRSSYKITDEATVKDIWEYVQNNKK